MSTAIMHSTSLYDFGEYPRNKNQNNTSRSNSQMIVGGGGVGGGNVHNITPVGVSTNSSQLVFSSSSFNATSNSSNSSNANAQQSLNSNHRIDQLKIPPLNLLFELGDGPTTSQHKQQQQQHGNGGGGAHHSLHRTASQPATRHMMMENILEMFSLNGMKLLPELSFGGSASSSANSINSNNNGGSNSNNNNQHATSNTSSSSGHRKLERTQSEPLPQQVNTSRYKTELCRPYEEAGECKYGDKCQFAHGMQELRNLQRHPKYKTELCRTFHSVGFCPYGPRCHFVHNAEEARNHNRNVAAYHARLAAVAAAAGNNSSSQSSQGANRSNNNTNNGPSMINSNNHHHGHGHHHNQQQQHNNSALKTLSVVQLHTAAAAAILQQTSIAHHQQQQQQLHHHQQQQHHHHHQLPLSPALSMSTGSDRASPIGSLSLSPTTSMANFFPEAISPTLQQGAIPQPFLFPTSPPASPIEGLSPMASPPPSSPSLVAMKLGHGVAGGAAAGNNSVNTATGQEERLPVFNLLSSVVDPYSQLTL